MLKLELDLASGLHIKTLYYGVDADYMKKQAEATTELNDLLCTGALRSCSDLSPCVEKLGALPLLDLQGRAMGDSQYCKALQGLVLEYSSSTESVCPYSAAGLTGARCTEEGSLSNRSFMYGFDASDLENFKLFKEHFDVGESGYLDVLSKKDNQLIFTAISGVVGGAIAGCLMLAVWKGSKLVISDEENHASILLIIIVLGQTLMSMINKGVWLPQLVRNFECDGIALWSAYFQVGMLVFTLVLCLTTGTVLSIKRTLTFFQAFLTYDSMALEFMDCLSCFKQYTQLPSQHELLIGGILSALCIMTVMVYTVHQSLVKHSPPQDTILFLFKMYIVTSSVVTFTFAFAQVAAPGIMVVDTTYVVIMYIELVCVIGCGVIEYAARNYTLTFDQHLMAVLTLLVVFNDSGYIILGLKMENVCVDYWANAACPNHCNLVGIASYVIISLYAIIFLAYLFYSLTQMYQYGPIRKCMGPKCMSQSCMRFAADEQGPGPASLEMLSRVDDRRNGSTMELVTNPLSKHTPKSHHLHRPNLRHRHRGRSMSASSGAEILKSWTPDRFFAAAGPMDEIIQIDKLQSDNCTTTIDNTTSPQEIAPTRRSNPIMAVDVDGTMPVPEMGRLHSKGALRMLESVEV